MSLRKIIKESLEDFKWVDENNPFYVKSLTISESNDFEWINNIEEAEFPISDINHYAGDIKHRKLELNGDYLDPDFPFSFKNIKAFYVEPTEGYPQVHTFKILNVNEFRKVCGAFALNQGQYFNFHEEDNITITVKS